MMYKRYCLLNKLFNWEKNEKIINIIFANNYIFRIIIYVLMEMMILLKSTQFLMLESTYSIFFDINIYYLIMAVQFTHRQHNNDKVFHIGYDSGDCTENQVITFKDLYNAEWLISGHLNTNQWYNIGVVSNEDNISFMLMVK